MTTHYLTPGTYQPDATNTGIPVGTTLTARQGNVSLSTAGTTLTGLDIHGNVSVQAANCKLSKCRIRGYNFTGGNEGTKALVDCGNANCANFVMEDCLLMPDYPTYQWNGVNGHDYTLSRCKMIHVGDGVNIFNSHATSAPVNVLIQACYIDYLAWWPATDHSPPETHNDCIQWFSGSNVQIIGNTLNGFRSMKDDPYGYVGQGAELHPSAVNGVTSPTNQFYPTRTTNSVLQVGGSMIGPASGLIMRNNWIDGGAASLNVPEGKLSGTNKIDNNLFGHLQRLAGSSDSYSDPPRTPSDPNWNKTTVILGAKNISSFTGNLYADNRLAVVAR